jgi:antitoxin (DNA-binding transcriptional repressor) of toxin-antitoxin stability system
VARVVGISKAKAQLSELIAAVERGEEAVIARRGRPVATLRRAAPERPRRVAGAMAGLVTIADNFDEPLSDEELKEWLAGVQRNW